MLVVSFVGAIQTYDLYLPHSPFNHQANLITLSQISLTYHFVRKYTILATIEKVLSIKLSFIQDLGIGEKME